MILGYVRVSTKGQNLEAQLDALQLAGVERTFSEKISGSRRARPELDKQSAHASAKTGVDLSPPWSSTWARWHQIRTCQLVEDEPRSGLLQIEGA